MTFDFYTKRNESDEIVEEKIFSVLTGFKENDVDNFIRNLSSEASKLDSQKLMKDYLNLLNYFPMWVDYGSDKVEKLVEVVVRLQVIILELKDRFYGKDTTKKVRFDKNNNSIDEKYLDIRFALIRIDLFRNIKKDHILEMMTNLINNGSSDIYVALDKNGNLLYLKNIDSGSFYTCKVPVVERIEKTYSRYFDDSLTNYLSFEFFDKKRD